METIDIEVNGILHQASLHRSMVPGAHRTIVYYHGGGFIFGDKDDLPAYAIRKFTETGCDLVCMEYPKAPEMSLKGICDFTEKQLDWLMENNSRLQLSSDYILFGRSAGGYLVMMLTKRMMAKQAKVPDKVIVFYGYETFDSDDFRSPSEHYLMYPRLTWNDVHSAIDSGIVFKTSLMKRYPLYIYARQTGNWLKLLGIDQNSLSEETEVNIADFPKIWLAASRFDQDVNYSHSEQMNKKYNNSLIFTSSQTKHEFDQNDNQETSDLYKQLLAWL